MDYISDENVKDLAQHLIGIDKNIILIFAFAVDRKSVVRERV